MIQRFFMIFLFLKILVSKVFKLVQLYQQIVWFDIFDFNCHSIVDEGEIGVFFLFLLLVCKTKGRFFIRFELYQSMIKGVLPTMNVLIFIFSKIEFSKLFVRHRQQRNCYGFRTKKKIVVIVGRGWEWKLFTSNFRMDFSGQNL